MLEELYLLYPEWNCAWTFYTFIFELIVYDKTQIEATNSFENNAYNILIFTETVRGCSVLSIYIPKFS